MIRVEVRGLQEVKEKIQEITKSLDSAKVTLQMQPRSRKILIAQAQQGRNVVTLTGEDKSDLREAITSGFREEWFAPDMQAEPTWRKVWHAAGEWLRKCIADKIEDKRPVVKAPLSPAYAERKRREWGKTHPILVAGGDLLDDVREANVRVEKV